MSTPVQLICVVWLPRTHSYRLRVPRLSLARVSSLINCLLGRQSHAKFHPDRTFQAVYDATRAKENILFTQGNNVIVKKECEWDHEVQTDAALKQFLATLEIVEPLKPRDAPILPHSTTIRQMKLRRRGSSTWTSLPCNLKRTRTVGTL